MARRTDCAPGPRRHLGTHHMSLTGLDLSRCPALYEARQRSHRLLLQAAAEFESAAADLAGIETIALVGSLGRLEVGSHSDFDCIVVRSDLSVPPAMVMDRIYAVFGALQLAQPKRWGIYREPVSAGALVDVAALGSLEEAPTLFGKRIQLLLDAQPVYRAAAMRELQTGIIDWYGTGYLAADPARSWTYLINDLSRYLHAYAAWQQYKFERSVDDSWQLRQAKFRSSRIVTLAGLLLLLGDSNARADKCEWLAAQLHQPPLDRLHAVMTRYDAAAFARLLGAYEEAFAVLSEPSARRDLIATGPASAADLVLGTGAAFARIKHASQVILSTLTDFMLDRRGDWDRRFFERLLF